VAGFYVAYYAMMMRAHMDMYGTKEEQFARYPSRTTATPSTTSMPEPHADHVDDVMNSTLITSPYKVLDNCLLSDGASCLIFATEEWQRPIRPLVSQAADRGCGHRCGTDTMRLADRRPLSRIAHFRSKRFASQQAYAMAGIKNPAKELDCFEVHDAYSGVEMVSMRRPRPLRLGNPASSTRRDTSTWAASSRSTPPAALSAWAIPSAPRHQPGHRGDETAPAGGPSPAPGQDRQWQGGMDSHGEPEPSWPSTSSGA